MKHYFFKSPSTGFSITFNADSLDDVVAILPDDTDLYFVSEVSQEISINLMALPNYNPLGLRLNNPLNIRYNKRNNWVGLKGEQDGYCVFFSPVHGFRAALRLLCNYVKCNFNTVETIIARFAPSTENRTDNYIKFVCKYLSVKPTYIVNTFEDIKRLCWSMCLFELGYKNLSTTQLEVLTSCLNIASANYKYPIS